MRHAPVIIGRYTNLLPSEDGSATNFWSEEAMSASLATLMNWVGGVGTFAVQAPWISLAGLAMILATRVAIRLIDRLPEIMRAWTEHCRQISHMGRPAISNADPPARIVRRSGRLGNAGAKAGDHSKKVQE
jgi:hypothetical protein